MENLQETPKKSSEKSHHETEREKEEEIDAPIFTCEICYEPMLSNKKFNNKGRCIHPFCMDCVAKYIQVKVEDDKEGKVECPGLNCIGILDPISCRPIIAHQVFDKWCDNLCETVVLGFDKCYCPFQDCSQLVLNECGEINVKKTKCPNCKKLFCFQCKIQWHVGYRCEETGQLRDRNDILLGQLVEAKKWARCPACGHCIELRSGCSIMKCRCKTAFCYNCGKEFNHGRCGCNKYQENLLFDCFVIILYILGFLAIVVYKKYRS